MASLAEAVLPLIRTRSDLSRWSTANAHGAQMHQAVDVLEQAASTTEPGEALTVTVKAISSAMTVIMRADDSSGVIGDACQRLLDLHPQAAARARPPAGTLVDWMIRFQFHNPCDYFTLDPLAYAAALGPDGIDRYRTRLAQIAAELGPRPSDDQRWNSAPSAAWFTLDHNARRLAVLDRDVDAVIATHARDRRVAAWLHDTAQALAEIDQIDLAIDWAQQAADFPDRGHQAATAAEYWCALLAEHRPTQLLDARLVVFDRWPSATTAARLHQVAGNRWPALQQQVMSTLAARPHDAVTFAQHTLRDLPLAWQLAHTLNLADHRTWNDLVKAYERLDPTATLPVHARLVEHDLRTTDAAAYRSAARRLARMRKLAADTHHATDVEQLIADLRYEHRRRPRLQQEFTRAGLP